MANLSIGNSLSDLYKTLQKEYANVKAGKAEQTMQGVRNPNTNLQKFLSLFVIVSLILSLIISFNFLKSFILNKKTQNEDALIFLLLVICIGYNLITSFITCCENQRNAVMIYPLIIVISNLSFLLFLKKLKKY